MTAAAEVCVVGGGPAGSTIAGRLAGLGHEVVLVERAAFPREHVGESLSPGTWPLLDVLGIDAVPCLRPPSRVRWGGAEWKRPAGEGGATVDRGAFDALLLDRAAACGVDVRQAAPARVARSDGGWEVRWPQDALRAAYLVDAAGRRGALGDSRHPTAPRTLCLHARWRATPADEVLVEERPDCWLWGAPLPDGTFRAMAFVDADRLRSAGIGRGGLPAHYRALLAGSELFAAVAHDGTGDGRVEACDATCFTARHVVDAGCARVGEAAFAIDPLSSSGVQLAIQTALSAATAIHTILDPACDSEPALEFYTEVVRHAAARHARLAAGFYARGPQDAAFWGARAAATPRPGELADAHNGAPRPPAEPAAGAALADLLAHPVRLARATRVADTPCIVGDRVERRPAIAHAALDRPVAFLGGHELVPLVDTASTAPTLGAAIDGWRAAGVAPPTAVAVARWLAEHGVIERRDAPSPARLHPNDAMRSTS